MIDFSEIKVFKTSDGRVVSYEDLLRDVYENADETRRSIRLLVDQMTLLIKTPADAMMIMAHVTQMIETRVKNDDLIIKIASIIGRVVQKGMSTKDSPEWEISEDERKQLMAEVDEVLSKEL